MAGESLGVMQADLADRLLRSTAADLDSPTEWERAQHFFCKALEAIRSQLPIAVREQLALRERGRLTLAELEVARVALWSSIQADPNGQLPRGSGDQGCTLRLLSSGTGWPTRRDSSLLLVLRQGSPAGDRAH